MDKAIEEIIRSYLQREAEAGHLVPGSNRFNAKKRKVQSAEKPLADTDAETEKLEEEFVQALYQCLEDKGVLREVQSFIRQRLVLILKGAWPKLVHTRIEQDENIHREKKLATLRLIQDFLCTHNLLFTFSVFSTELVYDGFVFKGDFGKLRAVDAEHFLHELGIPKDSAQSRGILKSYFGKRNWSLVEAIMSSLIWNQPSNDKPLSEASKKWNQNHATGQQLKNQMSLQEKLKEIDEKYAKVLTVPSGKQDGGYIELTDKRIIGLMKEHEKDNEIKLQYRMEKFKSEELAKIRDEIETKLKFEFVQKEKQLLKNYDEKMDHMQKCFNTEKQIWFMDKLKQDQLEIERRNRQVLLDCLHGTEPPKAGTLESNSSTSTISKGDEVVTPGHVKTTNEDISKRLESWKASIFENHHFPLSTNASMFKRDVERKYLLKEASLRTKIDKLETENQNLKTKFNPQESSAPFQQSIPKPQRQPVIKATPINEEEDARAFLQYTVECQAEQIGQLQLSIKKLTEKSATSSPRDVPRFDKHQPLTEMDLELFLEASKHRRDEIEKATNFVKERTQQFQSSRSTLQGKGGSTPFPAAPSLVVEKLLSIPTVRPSSRVEENYAESLAFEKSASLGSGRKYTTQLSNPLTTFKPTREIESFPIFPEITVVREKEGEVKQTTPLEFPTVSLEGGPLPSCQTTSENATYEIEQSSSADKEQVPQRNLTGSTVGNNEKEILSPVPEDGPSITEAKDVIASRPPEASSKPDNNKSLDTPDPVHRRQQDNPFITGALIRDKVPTSSEDETSFRSNGASIKSGLIRRTKLASPRNAEAPDNEQFVQDAPRNQELPPKTVPLPPPPSKSFALSLLDDLLDMQLETGHISDNDNIF